MRRIALLFRICYLVIVPLRYKDICNCIRVSSVIREFYLGTVVKWQEIPNKLIDNLI